MKTRVVFKKRLVGDGLLDGSSKEPECGTISEI
jgi:hypothetical protein